MHACPKKPSLDQRWVKISYIIILDPDQFCNPHATCILFSIFHTLNTATHIFSLCWVHWKAWKVSCQQRLCPSPTCLTLLFIGFKVALLLAGCKRDHFCFFWLTINNIFIYLNFSISGISVQNPELKFKLFWQNYCAGPNTPPRWFHLVWGTNNSK